MNLQQLNEFLKENEHCKSICSIIAEFRDVRELVELRSNVNNLNPLCLIPCDSLNNTDALCAIPSNNCAKFYLASRNTPSERKSGKKASRNCYVCRSRLWYENIKKSRKNEDKGWRVAPDSRVNVSSLSPESRTIRFQNIRNAKKKIAKLLHIAFLQDNSVPLHRKNKV